MDIAFQAEVAANGLLTDGELMFLVRRCLGQRRWLDVHVYSEALLIRHERRHPPIRVVH